ncbi:hypothetical protein DEI20_23905 [Salmonella enterica subsp. enterica serovar Newport]|nr:hypothetical protein [Salmonella enterica subsp. enterica serovar Newport]MJR82327.1 hypothetical protein [Salmonella enterica subsp. enterica serovar Newport]
MRITSRLHTGLYNLAHQGTRNAHGALPEGFLVSWNILFSGITGRRFITAVPHDEMTPDSGRKTCI